MRARLFSAPRHSFRAVLVVIFAALVFQLAAPDEQWARLVAVALQGTIVLVSLRAAGGSAELLRAGLALVLLLVAVSALAPIGLEDSEAAAPRIVSLALVLLAPPAIAIGLQDAVRESGRVTLETVYAGLCLYLLLGMAFAFGFNLCEDLSGNDFFADGVTGTSNDFLYFSLSTLTTTGYGDLTANTELGRTLSVSEALLGQIYLVTVVALLVSNLRRHVPYRDGP